MSVATEITRIQGAKSDIASAIENKGVTVPSSTKIDGMAALINKIDENRRDEAVEKDVIFIDFDGTILYSYTAAEFALLTELPTLKTHEENMTAVRWNWTLSDAKTYVSVYGGLVIGQECATTDGKTHVWIRLDSKYYEPYVGFTVNGTITINWGNGYTQSTLTGTSATSSVKYAKSPYTQGGYYHYTITPNTGTTYSIIGGSNGSYLCCGTDSNNAINKIYNTSIYKVRVGNGCGLHTYALNYCNNINTINIVSITGKTQTFYRCRNLSAIVLPYGMDTGAGNGIFATCSTARYISLPSSFGGVGTSAFSSAGSLSKLFIVKSTTSYGNQSFQDLSSIKTFVVPSEVTALGSYFMNTAVCLRKIKFLGTTPPTMGSSSFSSVSTDCIISVPTGSLSAYTSAANYPSSSTYTYIEE